MRQLSTVWLSTYRMTVARKFQFSCDHLCNVFNVAPTYGQVCTIWIDHAIYLKDAFSCVSPVGFHHCVFSNAVSKFILFPHIPQELFLFLPLEFAPQAVLPSVGLCWIFKWCQKKRVTKGHHLKLDFMSWMGVRPRERQKTMCDAPLRSRLWAASSDMTKNVF